MALDPQPARFACGRRESDRAESGPALMAQVRDDVAYGVRSDPLWGWRGGRHYSSFPLGGNWDDAQYVCADIEHTWWTREE